MTGEEWERIKTIFEAALTVPEPDRNAYLNAACGDQSVLYEMVRELLETHRDSSAAPPNPGGTSRVFREGEVIAGRFRIVRFIAEGGMGEVYEAYDERLRLRLALKTLRPELTSTTDALERFQREILLARGVSHENLCRVFDFIEHHTSTESSHAGGRIIPCLTMELIEGESLAEHLGRARPLPLDAALPLIHQIADGLDVLHSHGIIHRDLKPSNIMLTRMRSGRLRAVVMDFGLAKAEDGDSDLFESLGGNRAGAPYFMAPELFRQGRPSVASDLYAFGLIIDEMVTRTRAFSAQSLQALCFAKLWETPIAPRERADGLPEHWERTILRCLHPDPQARFGKAGEVVSALEESEAHPVAMATPAPKPWTGEAGGDTHTKARVSRRVSLLGAIAAMVLIPLAILARLTFMPVTTSIGVYEVENQTNDPKYDYLCKGTTNELMRRLTRLEGVQVIPMHATRSNAPQRSSSRFALDGMLQAHGGQLRLSVLVTDNQNGRLVWSENFDRRQIEDPLEVQSDIATGTVMALEKQVLLAAVGGERNSLAPLISRLHGLFAKASDIQVSPSPTRSNVALDYYMRGRDLLDRASPDSKRQAIVELKRAVAEDPTFALAYAALADAHVNLTYYAFTQAPELLSNARRHAETAISLDPNLAESHEALAWVQQTQWEWKGSEENHLKALRLKPGLTTARRRYAGLLLLFGRTDDAVAQTRRAFEEDPYDQSAAQGHGLYLFMAEKYEEALAVLEPAAQSRDALGACHNLGDVYARLAWLSPGGSRAQYYRKAFEQAGRVTEIEARLRLDPRRPTAWGDQMYAHYYSMRGEYRAAEPYLNRMLRDMNAGSASPQFVALIYAAQGQNAKALDLLERAAQSRDQFVPFVKVLPFFEMLRAEPRFKTLLAKIGL